MLSDSAVSLNAVVRRRGAASAFSAFLAAWILTSCGGGGSDSGSPIPTVDVAPPVAATKSVTTLIDPSLTGGTALALPRVTSVTDKQPVGMPLLVAAKGEHAVFAVDAAGNIALAGTLQGEATSVTLSAESTVLTFGVMSLGTLVPSASPAQLRATLRAASGFDALVSSVGQAVREGKNPLDQANVQAGFDTVFSAASAAAKPQSARQHPLAVARDRLEYGYEPVILNTATFEVRLANNRMKENTLASKVYLLNTSALTFTAGLLDLSGSQRASETLEGAGATGVSLPKTVLLSKPFPGAFSIRLLADDAVNASDVLKSAIELVVKVPGVSLSSQCTTAISKATLNFAVDVSFPKDPDNYVYKAVVKLFLDETKNVLTDCAYLKPDPTDLVALLATVKKIAKFVGFVRIAADQKLLPTPLLDTGVCLTEGQYLMSCVSLITADAIKPMMPDALQPINILILNDKGKKTLPPYGLKIEYSNPNLFELSPTMTQVQAKSAEGTGTLKITDPATDKTSEVSITVTNGKLEKAAYDVPVNGTVDVKLVDPASGSEVYRSAAFNIYVANDSFGTFTYPANLGPLTFRATNVATPTPQPIRLNGAKDSGATMTVNATSSYWLGTFTKDPCTVFPEGYWFWEHPCYNIGVTSGQYNAKFWFPVAGGKVTMESDSNGGLRRVYDTNWNATDMAELRLSFPTEILLPFAAEARYVRFSGARSLVLNVNRRSATEIGGTFVVTAPGFGAFDCNCFDFVNHRSGPVESRGTGTWSARLVSGSMPITQMNGFDLCYSDGGATNYLNLNSVVFSPGNGNYYTSLSAGGAAAGTCVYGR